MLHKSVLIVLGSAALAACHGAQLSATPSALSACPESANGSVVTIAWDASEAVKDGTVKLWIHSPADAAAKPTLWTEQIPKGSAATGKWATPGTWISLTDAKGVNTLAEIRIGRIRCKQ